MSTDFRALCAELLQPLAEYDDANPYRDCRPLIQRADAALARPKLQRSVRLDEGRVRRGNGSGGPSTPKPALVSQGSSPRSDGSSPRSDGSSPRSDGSSPRSDGSSPRSDGSSPRSDGSSPRSVTPAPLDRCPGEGHWEGDEFQWMEGCDDCRRRTATEGPVSVRPPEITFKCPYRLAP
jgi:hypothetical protein